jgi:hypothetical protein
MIRVVLSAACLLLVSCATTSRLSEVERAKLDAALQRLLAQEQVDEKDYDTTVRADGVREFGLSVRSNNADEIRKAGIRVSSVFGDVVIVRVTLDELKKLVTLSSVRSVQNSSRNYPQ